MDSTSNFDCTCPDSGLDLDMSSIHDWTSTAPNSSRKRKHDQTLSRPQFSSTLNESMIESLKEFHLNPNTPEKQQLFGGKLAVASPIQETHDILYSGLVSVKTSRKKLTPRKWKSIDSSWTRKSLKVDDILANSVVMEKILQYVSGGDLYRVTKVSAKFKGAVFNDRSAYQRYLNFMEVHKVNKENYIITPPSSPEKSDSPPRVQHSNFDSWVEEAQYLRGSGQHLARCSLCDKPSLVEYNIVQCRHCGYVRCTNCSSFSRTGPANFTDRCNSAVLRLEDSTNLRDLSWFASSSPEQHRHHHDSGVSSGSETPPSKVKRALFRAGEKKIFGSYNDNRIIDVVVVKKKKQKEERVTEKVAGYVSVVPVNKQKDVKDCSPSPTRSPPRSMNKVAWQRFKKRLTL